MGTGGGGTGPGISEAQSGPPSIRGPRADGDEAAAAHDGMASIHGKYCTSRGLRWCGARQALSNVNSVLARTAPGTRTLLDHLVAHRTGSADPSSPPAFGNRSPTAYRQKVRTLEQPAFPTGPRTA